MQRRDFLQHSLNHSFAASLLSVIPFGSSVAERVVEPLADPHFVPAKTIPVYRPNPENWSADEVTMAWIGHSTVLCNFFGCIILTDPILFERVGLYLFGATFGPTRLSPPALNIQTLPKPDVVLLSHAHMDHCDIQSLSALTEKYPREIDVVIAKNTKDVVQDLQWKSVREMDWNEHLRLETKHGELNIKALEVRHFGWRLPGDLDRAAGKRLGRSFNAYLLERNGKRIVFGGDTAMTGSFRKAFFDDPQPVDIVIMPIGAYQPWKSVHCNPEEALEMARDMKAQYFVPIHCQTFPLGRESTFEPMERLQAAIRLQASPKLALDAIGKTFVLPTS
ncbi:MAG: MBL fold metallo-hydrolase [Candidatus Kapabacteria bacterium]|jgi:L-ascorbate metabolism protein UlaG (beta-lactamase superfamily)|nr:MBL fold metallo-hydrolase [Candidatus Kapabacteria bacterium]